VLLPFTPIGEWFGFVAPSPVFLLAIAGLVAVYLMLAKA
jgi:Mg2+-importing ATPase